MHGVARVLIGLMTVALLVFVGISAISADQPVLGGIAVGLAMLRTVLLVRQVLAMRQSPE